MNSINEYVLLDYGANYSANKLREIRWHIEAMNDKDKNSMNGCPVVGYDKNGNEVICWYVRIEGAKVSFSKNSNVTTWY